jgi:hypothetical protein
MGGFALFSRRRFLTASLSAGAAVAAGASGLWALRGSAPDVAGLRSLGAHAYRTLAHLARALFPEGGAFPPGASGVDLARMFDVVLADEPEWNQSDLKAALFLLELGPLLFEGRLTTFSSLNEAEALAHFQRWQQSHSLVRRQVALAFRKFLCVVFYDRPEVWKHIGYDGPLIRAEGP